MYVRFIKDIILHLQILVYMLSNKNVNYLYSYGFDIILCCTIRIIVY